MELAKLKLSLLSKLRGLNSTHKLLPLDNLKQKWQHAPMPLGKLILVSPDYASEVGGRAPPSGILAARDSILWTQDR